MNAYLETVKETMQKAETRTIAEPPLPSPVAMKG